jgi:cation diffusion facilitator CzcD-associated flavoprotein CzcO
MGVPVAHQVVVIGAGFGGIGMAIALKCAGIEDFVVADRAGDLGGTWRDNTYPGLTCDIPSQLYSFSFRPWRWSRRFPPREEILAYLHALGRRARPRLSSPFQIRRRGSRVRRRPLESHP